jgi:DHA3 family macrolide efflux protein-like MFS transporter
MKSKISTGWETFRVLWVSQSVSLLGTGMTRFAVLVWAYEQSGSATTLALLGFFSVIAYVIASPFAGVLVDRWDRRIVMFLSDLGAGLMTATLLVLYAAGWLEIWHLYLAEAMAGAFEAFQEPAFSASVSLLVPKESYTRANGLLGLGKSAARMFAPAIAGLLQSVFGLGPVMVADLASMGLAVSALLFVRIPAPPISAEGRFAQRILGQELRFGARYIIKRPGLRSLLFSFFLVNLFGTLTYFAVLAPMILARTGGDEIALGVVRTLMGLGGITGGVMISLWGGARRKTRTYLVSTLFSFLICDFLMAISRSTAGWSLAGFLAELSIPFIVSPYFALWQELVPPDVQGRVFSTREAVQVLSQPFGYLLGGLLADRLFEPAMQGGGILVTVAARLVGTGAGSGMSAMFLFTSLLGGLTGLLGLLSPAIRSLDTEVSPDRGPVPEVE